MSAGRVVVWLGSNAAGKGFPLAGVAAVAALAAGGIAFISYKIGEAKRKGEEFEERVRKMEESV